jgi:hypothetical protein
VADNTFVLDPEHLLNHRLDVIYCWVATHPDGTEGIIGVETPDGRLMAAVTGKRETAEGPLAQLVERMVPQLRRGTVIELRQYGRGLMLRRVGR